MRTTSSLEANNGAMNATIVNHGNFFSFVHNLRTQEFASSLKFGTYCKSGGQAKAPRAQYKVICTFSFMRCSSQTLLKPAQMGCDIAHTYMFAHLYVCLHTSKCAFKTNTLLSYRNHLQFFLIFIFLLHLEP